MFTRAAKRKLVGIADSCRHFASSSANLKMYSLWGGSSAARTRCGRLSTAPRHLRPSEALCTGRGASRRRPTSVAASAYSLPAALARPGRASPARPPRSAGSGPCGRHLGPAASCARASPSLSPPGVLACEAVFGLQLPVFPRVPFLVCGSLGVYCPLAD